nr:unnamed protein product [Callosobruchus analis]
MGHKYFCKSSRIKVMAVRSGVTDTNITWKASQGDFPRFGDIGKELAASLAALSPQPAEEVAAKWQHLEIVQTSNIPSTSTTMSNTATKVPSQGELLQDERGSLQKEGGPVKKSIPLRRSKTIARRREDPCEKKDDPCNKKEDTCRNKDDPCKPPNKEKKKDSCRKDDKKPLGAAIKPSAAILAKRMIRRSKAFK